MISAVNVIIQARMGSTRLPGKILKNLCGKPMLWQVIQRLSKSEQTDKIIVATTDLEQDDLVEKFCVSNDILYYRGSSDDVLSRYYNTYRQFPSDIIVRITADCPLIDQAILDEMIIDFKSNVESVDYLSNTLKRTYPRGLDVEIFSSETLELIYEKATSNFEREHVTPYIYNHPELFRLRNFENRIDYSSYRWTVDTKEDFDLITKIYEYFQELNSSFDFNDILNLFKSNPELHKINAHIEQKKI